MALVVLLLLPKIQNRPSTFLVPKWSLYFLEFATVHPCVVPVADFAAMPNAVKIANMEFFIGKRKADLVFVDVFVLF